MKKITELTETRWRTVYYKDEYGNRERDTEYYTAYRTVRSVTYGRRISHAMVDLLCFEAVAYLINYLLELLHTFIPFSTSLSLTLGLITSLIFLILYPALYTFCEWKWQQTPGKFLTKTIVIDEYGNKPELSTLVLRSVIRLVPFDVYSCYGTPYSYGWHDQWSNTWVVTKEEWLELKKLQAEQSESVAHTSLQA